MITRNLRLPFFTMIHSIIWMWLVVALVVVPTINVIVVTAFHPILLSSTTTISKLRPPLSSSSSSSSSSAVVSMSKIHSRSSRFRHPTLLNVAMIPTIATVKSTSTSTTDSSSKSQQQRSSPPRKTSTAANNNDSKKFPSNKRKNDIGNKASDTATVGDDDDDDDDDNINAGVVGNWENLYGNWVLRPTSTKSSVDNDDDESTTNITPRAVIHFLGGALVGKAPHITYRFLLEKLADEGFLIVATPYDLSFDHLVTCDDVLTKFENVAPTLARQYGALPVVGIGHSCGALLQVLISCLFPDTPRAANALLSFNNKPVSEAVPFFEDFFAPVFSSLATQPIGGGSTTTTGTDSLSSSQPVRGPSSNDSLVLGLKLAKAASQGKLPSDELLNEAQSMFNNGLKNAAGGASLLPTIPIPFASPFGGNNNDNDQNIKISSEIRDTYAKWAEPAVTALTEVGLLPVIHETIVTLEQIPRLIDEVADGARDFNPTPAMVRSAAGKAYRARRTLILGYDDDPIDESDEVEEVLREARSITRMRRPMVEIDVQRKSLSGGHVAPLLAPPLDVAGRAEDLLGLETSQERLGYREAAATVEALVRWLDEGNL